MLHGEAYLGLQTEGQGGVTDRGCVLTASPTVSRPDRVIGSGPITPLPPLPATHLHLSFDPSQLDRFGVSLVIESVHPASRGVSVYLSFSSSSQL